MQTIEIHYNDIGCVVGYIQQDKESPGRKSQRDSCRGTSPNCRYPCQGEANPRAAFFAYTSCSPAPAQIFDSQACFPHLKETRALSSTLPQVPHKIRGQGKIPRPHCVNCFIPLMPLESWCPVGYPAICGRCRSGKCVIGTNLPNL